MGAGMLSQAVRRASLRAASSRSLTTDVSVPVTLHGLDGRYATSLWKVASEKGELAKVEKDLTGFKSVMGAEAVDQLLNNPSIPKGAKQAAVADLMKKSGFVESTQNFFSVLAENGRLSETSNIISKFEELQRAAKGELYAEVTVADELTKEQKKSVEASLKSFMSEGQKVSVDFQVKPEILGGLVVNVGDKHINMSILSRIQQLTNVLQQPM